MAELLKDKVHQMDPKGDITELLKDNMEVEQRRVSQSGEGSQDSDVVTRVSRWEVPRHVKRRF